MGKITVKHYLNRKLNPEINESGKYYPLYVSLTVNKHNIRKKSSIDLLIPEDEFDEGKSEHFLRFDKQMKYEAKLLTDITKRLLDDCENNKIESSLIYSSFNCSKSNNKFMKLLVLYINYYTSSIFNAIEYSFIELIRREIYSKMQTIFTFKYEGDTVERMFSIEYTPWYLEEFIKDNLSYHCLNRFYLVEILRDFLSPYCLETAYDIPLQNWINGEIQPKLRKYMSEYNNKKVKTPYINIDEQKVNEYINTMDEIINTSYLEYTEKCYEKGFKSYI